MFSNGALNGAVVNAKLVNGGNFIETASGTVTVTVAGTSSARRRVRGAATLGVALVGTSFPNRRQRLSGTATVLLAATNVARRRAHSAGVASVAITGASIARRRLVGTGTCLVLISASSNPSWRFLQRAPRARTMFVAHERREMFVGPRDGTIMVPGARFSMLVQRQRRDEP